MRRNFEVQMGAVAAVLVVGAMAGCSLESIRVPGALAMAGSLVLVTAALSPALLYLREKGKQYWFEGVLTVFWGLVLSVLIHFPVAIAVRMGAGNPLRDHALARFDEILHCNVPALSSWAQTHLLGQLGIRSGDWMEPGILAALILPVVFGHMKSSQRFIVGKLVALALCLPIFALLPAVGPWSGQHMNVSRDQAATEAALLAARLPSPAIYSMTRYICFPSFHTISALLFAQALWCFRWFRAPVALLCGFFVFSTMATGWDYAGDVLAGLAVGAIAIFLRGGLCRRG